MIVVCWRFVCVCASTLLSMSCQLLCLFKFCLVFGHLFTDNFVGKVWRVRPQDILLENKSFWCVSFLIICIRSLCCCGVFFKHGVKSSLCWHWMTLLCLRLIQEKTFSVSDIRNRASGFWNVSTCDQPLSCQSGFFYSCRERASWGLFVSAQRSGSMEFRSVSSQSYTRTRQKSSLYWNQQDISEQDKCFQKFQFPPWWFTVINKFPDTISVPLKIQN